MSQSFIFWNDCWIYLRKSELQTMQLIVKILQKEESMTLYNIVKSSLKIKKLSSNTITMALFKLLAGRIIKVQQHGENRIFSLTLDWEEKLKKALCPFQK